ncbi:MULTISPECIES: hypothetical protein [Enterobacter cloacae complex]|uniref:hypothetical protein n=1 Tax=Enterobacter cloacae complex TaxID=354276 RepID=UPI002974E667|nr:hypothetical protein [Enterobacter ludwigii]WRM06495.1 hypothetical protein Q5384_09755 [Enterobacter ludwigii]HAS0909950.1 hypothetical protein [Enterobacter cloacae]
MDFLTFLSSVIKSLAWPVLLASVLYYGRNDLFKLIRTIKSIKYDKFEMMFEEQAAEAAGEAENISGKEKDNSERYKDFVFLSPYETVMKSYLKLEDSLRNAVKRKVDDGTIELPPHTNDRRFEVMSGNQFMRLLYKAGLVDVDFAALHDSLRNLRNMAAHKHNFEISQDAAKNFADSSIALIDKLEEI